MHVMWHTRAQKARGGNTFFCREHQYHRDAIFLQQVTKKPLYEERATLNTAALATIIG